MRIPMLIHLLNYKYSLTGNGSSLNLTFFKLRLARERDATFFPPLETRKVQQNKSWKFTFNKLAFVANNSPHKVNEKHSKQIYPTALIIIVYCPNTVANFSTEKTSSFQL